MVVVVVGATGGADVVGADVVGAEVVGAGGAVVDGGGGGDVVGGVDPGTWRKRCVV